MKTENSNARSMIFQITTYQCHHQTSKCPNAKQKNSAHFRTLSTRCLNLAHSKCRIHIEKYRKQKLKTEMQMACCFRSHPVNIVTARQNVQTQNQKKNIGFQLHNNAPHTTPALARTSFLASLSAPASSSSRTQSTWPFSAANISAVDPFCARRRPNVPPTCAHARRKWRQK